ncbi:MAG: YhgE/Pip domain-containing protein, partial [Eggerthellaceae bacterium]|nr:YhgE/Pip domain-containing protein [Eggerthellaceae bacterium]
MRNVWLVFRQDIQHLTMNVVSIIIAIGLVTLPSLFAWYNLLACWNVFDNTGNLKVAVANSDEGYESDLVPIRVNIGDKVVSALYENDQIDWVFTNEDDAIEGTKAGRYYAALVIPESFSKDMLTFYTSDVEHANINYYVNEKKNAIAPRITEIGADTISYEINETFADTLSEVALGLSQSFSKYAEEGDVDGRIAQLSAHMRHVSDRMDQTAEVLRLYSSLADESQSLIEGCIDLINYEDATLDSAMDALASGEQSLREMADVIRTSADDLSAALEENQAALDNLESSLDTVFADASASARDCAGVLREAADDLYGPIKICDDRLEVLYWLRSILPEGHTEIIDAAIAVTTHERDILLDTQNELLQAAEDLEAADADVQADIEAIKQQIAQARADIDAIKADFETNLKPSLQQLAADLDVLSGDLSQGMASIDVMGDDLVGTMDSAAAALGTASSDVNQASANLEDASQDIRDLADAVDAALASNDLESLKEILQGNVVDLASMLSAPVEVNRVPVFPASNFGSAMAPIYNALALFVGSLLIMVSVKPQVSQRGRKCLNNPKPRHLYFGRFGVVAVLSFLQSTLLALGNLFFLQVQAVHPLLFMLCYWFSGLVYAFIIYTLVVSFENLGKGIAVLMLIVQVTGCGGSYPLQLLPDFVQKVSPWLPATHVVNA